MFVHQDFYPRKYLTKKFDLSDITPKQIYYCWSLSTQSAYKFDDNPVKSAIYLLKNVYRSQNCELIMEKNTSDIVAIAFSTLILKYAQKIEAMWTQLTKQLKVTSNYMVSSEKSMEVDFLLCTV